MAGPNPRVSIGLPVRDGARFLRAALDSILGQTFADFELIVSDNASTDDSAEICRQYASRDRRIRFVHLDSNVGAARNFNAVFDLARGEYFKWAAHDDVVAPEFLERCVAALDADAGVVLCHSEALIIDAADRVLEEYPRELTQVGSPRAHERFADLILHDHKCFEAFALVRRSVMGLTPLLAPYPASDRVLLAELGLRGRFHHVPERLFVSRWHAGQSINAFPGLHLRTGWFDPRRSGAIVFPHWKLWLEYARAVFRVDVSARERLGCIAALLRWPAVNWNGARMVRDLLIAARAVARTTSHHDRGATPGGSGTSSSSTWPADQLRQRGRR